MQTAASSKTFDPWQATQALTGMATRVMGSEDYLGRNVPTVGTRVSDHAFELFAACPPAEALQLQFEAQQPTFIALHDVGAALSARFLAELAAALRLPLQTLAIRRQGAGQQMALLKFIEVPALPGPPLRVYGTAADADAATRRPVADMLLAFSRLGVLLVGAAAPHAVAAQLAPLRDRLLTVPWCNQHLLLVPAAAQAPELAHPLADAARRLVAGTAVAASITPLAHNTAARWGFIHGAWNRLRTQEPEPRAAAVAPPTEPLAMRPMPAARKAAGAAASIGNGQLAHYAKACALLKGAIDCCVFDLAQGHAVAHAGRPENAVALATQGSKLLAAALYSGTQLGDTGGSAEALITLERQLLFVRQLPQQSSLGMLAVFNRAQVNPMVLRLQLQRLESLLDTP